MLFHLPFDTLTRSFCVDGIAEKPVHGKMVVVQIQGDGPRGEGYGIRKYHPSEIGPESRAKMDDPRTRSPSDHRNQHLEA